MYYFSENRKATVYYINVDLNMLKVSAISIIIVPSNAFTLKLVY